MLLLLVRFYRRLLLSCPLLQTLAFAVSTFADACFCSVRFCGHLTLPCPLLWTHFFCCLSTFADTLLLPCPLLWTPCFCFVHFYGHTVFALSTFVDTYSCSLSTVTDTLLLLCPLLWTPCFCFVHFCGHPAIYCLSTFVDTLFLFLVRFCGYLLFVVCPPLRTLAFVTCPLLWTPCYLLPVHFCGHPVFVPCPLLRILAFCCLSTFADACFCYLSTFVDTLAFALSAFVDTLLLPCPLLWTHCYLLPVRFCGHPALLCPLLRILAFCCLSTFADACFFFIFCALSAISTLFPLISESFVLIRLPRRYYSRPFASLTLSDL